VDVVKCLVHLSNCFTDLPRLPSLVLYLIDFYMGHACMSVLHNNEMVGTTMWDK